MEAMFRTTNKPQTLNATQSRNPKPINTLDPTLLTGNKRELGELLPGANRRLGNCRVQNLKCFDVVARV